MKPLFVLFALTAAPIASPLRADAPPSVAPGPVPRLSLADWLAAPPVSFRYDGRDSAALLASWPRSEEAVAEPASDPRQGPDAVTGGELHRYVYVDPATHLEVTAEIRTFPEFAAIDWVLKFRNGGSTDTPLIDAIQPLRWTFGPIAAGVLHHARGSSAQSSDFEPLAETLSPGRTVELQSEKGLSSSGQTLPFFNLQAGSGGVIGAIGWSGGWQAAFACDRGSRKLTATAGMPRTHLRLHPGEEIRSPRILLLHWTGGDWEASQNLWRRLLLAHYAPRSAGRPLPGPVLFGSWGSEPIDRKLALIQTVQNHRMPFDVYAVDAGWYGKTVGETEEESDRGPAPWWRTRGDWWPDARYYPHGLKPLGDALDQAGLGFSLWIEPETAEPGTRILTEHPEWFLHVPHAVNDGAALLNLGDPAARAGITRLVSDLITQAHVTWYRQDFNIPPAEYWAHADAPDRIGMTEIRHIEGLYAFWDELRARHPGLCIDNCASGGRRLDLEMISRSFNVWRSDYGCADDVAEQMQTQALSPWVPLNVGIETLWTTHPWERSAPFGNDAQLYAMRCGYSAGYGSNPGPAPGGNEAWLAWEKRVLAEYREVQPYFYGDFHPLLPYTLEQNAWTAWQWDRPDLKAGLVLVLRRPQSLFTAMELSLRALDPAAQYEVEIRTGLDRTPVRVMSGRELGRLPVSLPARPSSVLILYRRRAPAPAFDRTGSSAPADLSGLSSGATVDVVNPTGSFMLVAFEHNDAAAVSPSVARLAPGGRQTLRLSARAGAASAALSYAVSCAPAPFVATEDRYRAYCDGETVQIVPVDPRLQAAVEARARYIFTGSRIRVTDPEMPRGTFIYTPSPYYREAGVFGRDFLFQLEGGGRDNVTAEEVRRAVDFMALKQLPADRVVRGCTFPRGALPDRVRPDGLIAWGPGPGDALGDRIGRYHRPSMDEAMCFVTLAWHYGHKAAWDARWQAWFRSKAEHFTAAWNSVPRNPRTGLVTQWTTPGHIGGSGVAETTGPCVMWGFHDSYGFPGDDLGTSVLACNAARALADMYDHAGDRASARTWSATAGTMRDAIRAQFNPAGYLPWGVGAGAPVMASPDITGYAVWSEILTDAQADAASDWLAACYRADRTAGGAADLFNLTPGLRGTVRMARKADDVYPGSHVWPHAVPPYWENLTYGYNAYQDGGYWYYMSLGIADALWRRHPAEAREWAAQAYGDLVAGGENYPYERIDGTKPVNFRYNASIGSLLGIGRAATLYTLPIRFSALP